MIADDDAYSSDELPTSKKLGTLPPPGTPAKSVAEWRELGYRIPEMIPARKRVRVYLDKFGVLWIENEETKTR